MDQNVRGVSFDVVPHSLNIFSECGTSSSFEELVLSDLLFTPVLIEFTDKHGKAFTDSSGCVTMCATDYLVLEKGDAMLPIVPFVPTLLRGYAQFPVWDFVYVAKAAELHMSTVVSIQCSVSAFRDHEKGTAEIATAFVTGRGQVGRSPSPC
jgi:hypothetical protein